MLPARTSLWPLCATLLAVALILVGCASRTQQQPPTSAVSPPAPPPDEAPYQVVGHGSQDVDEATAEPSEPAAEPEPETTVPEGAATPPEEQPRAEQETLRPETDAPTEPEEPGRTALVGEITLASHVPDPSTVPYKDCVTFVKYRVDSLEAGEYQGEQLLAVFWGMKDARLQPAARFSAGQKHRLTIEPFAERNELARVMQADDTNEYTLTPYWVTEYTEAK